MPIKIRQLASSDRPAIVRLLEGTKAFSALDVPVAMELVDIYLENPENCGYYFIVAEESAAIAGYICYGPTPLTQGTWDLYWMATAEQQQRKGIAGSLLKMAEDDIVMKNGRMTIIETSSTELYEPARNFFLRHNYTEVGVITDFYSIGDNMMIYRKIL